LVSNQKRDERKSKKKTPYEKRKTHKKTRYQDYVFNRAIFILFLCQHHKVSKKKVDHHKKNFDKKSEMLKNADPLAHAHAYFWI
jgi:hypothetical protein